MDDASNKYRIGKFTGSSMIFLAIVFDVVEILLDLVGIGILLSFVIDFLATFIFWFWFNSKGVSTSSPKATGRFWATHIVEWLPIPVLDVGILTLGTILMITNSRAEDKFGVSLPQAKSSNVIKTSNKSKSVAASAQNTQKSSNVIRFRGANSGDSQGEALDKAA